jgi:hypothetical protein
MNRRSARAGLDLKEKALLPNNQWKSYKHSTGASPLYPSMANRPTEEPVDLNFAPDRRR